MFLLRRSKAASAPASNGNKRQFSQKNLNNATGNLQTALNKIANQHVLKYANAVRANAKAQANAVRANAVAAEASTPTNLKNAVNAAKVANAAEQRVNETEKAAEAAVNAVPPSESVSVAVQSAEAAAVLNVNKLIQNIQATNNLNAFLKSRANNITKIPANRKNNVNAAIATKRATVPGNVIEEIQGGPRNNKYGNNKRTNIPQKN
jgi:hypothetical protein